MATGNSSLFVPNLTSVNLSELDAVRQIYDTLYICDLQAFVTLRANKLARQRLLDTTDPRLNVRFLGFFSGSSSLRVLLLS